MTAKGTDANIPWARLLGGEQFVRGFATQVALDVELLARPGTTVVGRDDRAGSGAAACYWIGSHLVVWADPAVVDRLGGLTDATRGATPRMLAAFMDQAGLTNQASADMRLPVDSSSRLLESCSALLRRSLPAGLDHRWLAADKPADVAMIKRFVDRSDPDEVEEAGLDEMDDFDEAAINVLTTAAATDSDADGPAGRISAYASACVWDWDPAFGDVGVLVDVGFRNQRLGQFVSAATVSRLLADSRLPLYRHEQSNLGSKGIATGLGFEPVTNLSVYKLPYRLVPID